MPAEQLTMTQNESGITPVAGPSAVVRQSLTPMDLLTVALQNNAAIDVIERLAALQEKAMAREAEIGFAEAMNRVQAEIKRVAPDMENTEKQSKWASYAAIDRVIRPIYSKEGFSLSFSDDEQHIAEHVRIICYVSRGAHTRIYRKDMPVDTKGPKGGDVMTRTHATGAADSYAKRYLVKDIFNIAIGEEDRDGNPVTMGELNERLEWIENCSSIEELKKIFTDAFTEAKKLNDKNAMKAIVAAKDKKRKELQ